LLDSEMTRMPHQLRGQCGPWVAPRNTNDTKVIEAGLEPGSKVLSCVCYTLRTQLCCLRG
jgi:hypothetical protein